MISICIATYNGAKFINEQLQSVLHQLGTSDEVIVSDDGSSDSTIEIINNINDSRIKVFKNTLRSGPVGNFENAIQKANGSIIFLCDQDDIWFPEKIRSHLELHDKYDLVISNATVIDEKKNVLFDSFFKQRGSKGGLVSNLIKNSYIGCCMSFNRKIAQASIPFPRSIHMHDWWIGLVAEVKGDVFFLNKPLMYYIRHDNNASGTLIKTLPLHTQLKNRLIMLTSLLTLIRRK